MKIALLLVLFATQLLAQTYSISGYVTDARSNLPLPNANVWLINKNVGETTNENGFFYFQNLNNGSYTLKISYIGYKTNIKTIKITSDREIKIKLKPKSIILENTIVNGTYPKFRESAVAFKEFNSKDINYSLGSREAINIIETSPSVNISPEGGGIGEHRLNIRGFDQTNISVMINGIPINNPENGEIYWSNWSGIADIIKYIHVQRGLSAVPYSTSSIGGNVNIITGGINSTGSSYLFKSEFGAYNLKKTAFLLNTKITDGINISGLFSKRTLDGYANQTYSDEYAYYFSLNMVGKNNVLQIQLFGSPQEHGQRLTPQTIANWKKFGKKYNADYGYLNGKVLNLRDNEFHNPTLSIKHNWQISENSSFTNIVSLSRGSGGGTVPPWYPQLSRTDNGLIDFDKEWQLNNNNIDSNYDNKLNRSIIALRKGVHKNYWANLISVYKFNYNKYTFNFGLDAKYYKAQNYNELKNLLGGDYYIGSGNVNADPNEHLFAGDKVDFNADSFTKNIGGFLLAEYKNNKLTSYLNLAISNIGYNRIDYFNYLKSDPKRETGWNYFTSKTIKAGVNYNLNLNHNVYLNAGLFSRAPLSQNVYDYSNNKYKNIKNEKIISLEAGYNYVNNLIRLNLNYYYTLWNDKAFSQAFRSPTTEAIYYYNIFGASALHTGIETDWKVIVTDFLNFNGMISYSNNKWTSNVNAYLRPESNPSDKIKYFAYTNELFVGNYPMIMANLGIDFKKKIGEKIIIFVNPLYKFYGKRYANYFPELRTNKTDEGKQPWRLPDFYNIDIHTGIDINLESNYLSKISLSFNVFNVFNEQSIVSAIDGSDHTSKTALVWYSSERWWSTSISLGL